VATPGALQTLARAGQSADEFIARHTRCDWGEVCGDDWKLNDEAVAHEGDLDRQGRVLSAYCTKLNERIWCITEADRSSSCLLLPAEY
jgi:hypothetical protein